MSRNRRRRRSGCGIALTVVVVIILIIAAGLITLINLTPRQLGLEAIAINGETIDDMGLADVKLINIYKNIKSLYNADETQIVTNPYDSEVEAQKSSANLKNSSLSDTDDYSSIVSAKVVYDDQYVIEYSDSTLAYIFDNAIQNSSDSEEAMNYLKNANISIKEITISVENNKGLMRIVSCISLGEYKTQVAEALGALSSIVPIPDKVYVVSELYFTIDAEGKMVTESKSICINGDNNNLVSKAIISLVLSSTDEVSGEDALNAKLGEGLSSVVYNLGAIGTANVDENNCVVGEITYGLQAVSSHKIKVITHVSAS